MRAWRDFKQSELALAAIVALPIPFLAAYALALQSGPHGPDLPSIDRGAAVPIRVKPVLDLESPNVKLGGGKVKVKMPSAWADPAPPAQLSEVRPSTRAKDDPAAIPSKELPLASSSSPDVPPDARSAAPVASSDAASGNAPPTTSGGAEVGSGDGKAPPGPGDPGGDPNGDPNADPRKKNAARRYLGRVVAWFTSRFRAPCANIPPEERARYRAVASVTLGPDGTVVGYTLSKSGNPDIDSAAERAMQSAQGQQVPPPPEDFPELRPNSTNVTFVCGS
jgi:hypothetical protein